VTFGSGITPGFGRLDGTVSAVLVPTVAACGHDDNHAIVQVSANGSTYQLWVNVGYAGMPDVGFAERDSALGNDPFKEGWHPGGTLDYVAGLGVHSTDFTLETQDVLSATMMSDVTVGSTISIYGVGFTTNDGAHLVHFNGAGQDGAVVVHPDSAPHFLLFDFTNQTFLVFVWPGVIPVASLPARPRRSTLAAENRQPNAQRGSSHHSCRISLEPAPTAAGHAAKADGHLKCRRAATFRAHGP
jgi:hypothetical protein